MSFCTIFTLRISTSAQGKMWKMWKNLNEVVVFLSNDHRLGCYEPLSLFIKCVFFFCVVMTPCYDQFFDYFDKKKNGTIQKVAKFDISYRVTCKWRQIWNFKIVLFYDENFVTRRHLDVKREQVLIKGTI